MYDAFYKLTNSSTQISSYVFDVVRASVPKMNLVNYNAVQFTLKSMNVTMRPATMQDDVFESKEEIAHTIKDELTKSMTGRLRI